jgi:hypothetical protein
MLGWHPTVAPHPAEDNHIYVIRRTNAQAPCPHPGARPARTRPFGRASGGLALASRRHLERNGDARVPLRRPRRRPSGTAAAYDLIARGEAASVVLADLDGGRAAAAAARVNRLTAGDAARPAIWTAATGVPPRDLEPPTRS